MNVRLRKKTSLARSLLLVNPALSKRSIASSLGISRSTLYHRSRQALKDQKLLTEILAVLEEHPHYGHRRVALVLGTGEYRVRRVMRRYGLKQKRRRKRQNYRQTKGASAIPNLIKTLAIVAPNVVWAGDFTELEYQGLTLYFATVIDLYTREIVGTSLGLRHSADLVVAALANAKERRGGVTPSIFHSDQGSEYESGACSVWLHLHQIGPSRSAKSHPWENGRQESFYGRFKQELGNLSRLPTLEDAIAAVHHHVRYYNTRRIHSALKMPPRAFYEKWRGSLKLLPAHTLTIGTLSTPV